MSEKTAALECLSVSELISFPGCTSMLLCKANKDIHESVKLCFLHDDVSSLSVSPCCVSV